MYGFAMMVQLATVSFTSFFLPLESEWWSVGTISWPLPSTYGSLMFHDVMLRGLHDEPASLMVLTGIGLILLLFYLAPAAPAARAARGSLMN